MNKDNIINLEPYLAKIAKHKLIDRLCAEHEGTDAERRMIRVYLDAELSDNPEFWHRINKMICDKYPDKI
tara:strand:- start:314 stop:523 length:210 start_codon:yes stop_codon:yes gene_type:complete